VKEELSERAMDIEIKWLWNKGLLVELYWRMVDGGEPSSSQEEKESDFLYFVEWLCELDDMAARYIPSTCRLRWIPE